MELGFERPKSQALDYRVLNLIKRWHGVGAVIQQRKEGETWPGEGQRWTKPPNSANSEEWTKSAYAPPVGFPSSKQQGMSSGKGASEDWRPGFPEEVGLEKQAELKDMGSRCIPGRAHSVHKGPEVSEQPGVGLRSGRKWLREVRMRVGRAGGLRGIERETAPGRWGG